jgi:hypothetical protein
MVILVQYLCPQRHCILAIGFEEGIGDLENAKLVASQMMKKLQINSHCGICGSRDLFFESGRTKYATLKEATPFFLACQYNQLMTRAALEAAGVTFDAARKN